MNTRQISLQGGVTLTAVQTDKFKSSYWSVRLLTPLKKETAALNAVLPFVLRRGTDRYPDMAELSAALDNMYGGVIEPAVRKCGDVQCIGFEATFLDDAYAPDGSSIMDRAATLLGDLLLHPVTKNGRLRQEYVKSEKENLLRSIRSARNDKRQYAHQRLIEQMYAGTDYAIGRLGTEATAEKISAPRLFDRYQSLLSEAAVELFYCGCASPERVEYAWRSALMDLPRSRTRYQPETDFRRFSRSALREFGETADITQCKLELGYQSGISADDPMYPALLVLNAMFGGSTGSRLFLHVREKRSLCYYASSSMDSLKGLMTVSCGVAPQQVAEARAEIADQLCQLQQGQFSREELDIARQSVINALSTAQDEQSSLCSLWLRDRAAAMPFEPDHLIHLVREVTDGEIAAAALQLIPDSAFLLSGCVAEEDCRERT